MKPHCGAIAAILALVLSGLDTAPAQDAGAGEPAPPKALPTRAELAELNRASEELASILRKSRELELQSRKRRASQKETIEKLAADKIAAERSVAVLDAEVKKHEKELAEKKAKLGKAEKDAAASTQEAAAVIDPLKGHLDLIESHIENGIPWRIASRKTAVQEARRVVTSPSASPAQAVAAVCNVQEAEEALGRVIEPGVIEMELDGEQRALGAFHVGLVGAAFASEDGKTSGWVVPGQKPEESLHTAAGAGKAYLDALDMLRRRRLPRVLDLLIPSLPAPKEEGR